MKNNLSKAFLVAVIGILIFPQVSFATWWNPLTWFQKPLADAPIEEVAATSTPALENLQTDVTLEIKAENIAVVEPEKETTSTKWWNPSTWKVFDRTPTVKVQETKQPTEIEKLRSEVEELKKKVATPTLSPAKPASIATDKTTTTTKPITQAAKPVVSATELKKENPQQYKTLVEENKTKLLEASKLLSNKNIIARVKPSVVYIETTSGSGSGIIVSADGYVLTNAHVVSGANSATVKLADGGSYNGTVVGRDENIDLALLKISASGLSPAFLGDSDLVEQGDSVFTFGYPLGIEGDVAFKDGTLSRRQKINGTAYLEISAQILPGNSGGPLVNQGGEVIGINTLAIGALKVSGILIGETLKYAIPVNVAKGLIPELKNGRNIVIPKPTVAVPTPSPTPSPSQPQPIFPPRTYIPPPPEPKPEPVRTTISNVVAKEESYGIRITWETNKYPVSERVLVGKSSDLADAQSYNKYQAGSISTYDPDTTYYYQVIAKDLSESHLSYDPAEVKSQILNVHTKPPLNPPAKISNLSSSKATRNSVVISWNTDIGTASKLEYRKQGEVTFNLNCSSSYCGDYTEILSRTSHTYTILKLSNDAIYEYRVTAVDPVNLSRSKTVSDVMTFKTLPGDKTPPSFTKLESTVYGDGVRISYQGNELIHSKLEYSVNPDMGSPITSLDNTNDLSEASGWGDGFDRSISNLSRGVTYYYRVTIVDQAGNKTISDVLNFKIPNIGSLSASSVPFPGSTLSAGNVDVEVFKIRMTASADESIKISRIVVATASSFPPYVNCSQFEYMSLYVDGIKNDGGPYSVTYGQGIVVNLATPVIIPAGSYKDFVIKASMRGSGGVCGFNLQTTGENKYNMDAVGMSSGVQIYITASEPLFGPFWKIE
ncbi:MAG: hypothetical protein COV91_02050 [Candidatus Taylorbacteria bacterium CG11_big_fil_rev_8_21_14_0_20_46_11]|uniref:Fibronectin type-III domain-containing protein n=1 Tax=Candidatus Taylorbacteria bacterium CG11_big_fil_rev_8_21_14_0_20_46_11 TaxID=1975025 RepID=A0A2H0KC55_9BACT|nr:MAG: hypothetical protein COV91_02050 [Candidatus Taylorbacteria bacterium CG11_big_fil_rev_8_21_14_0_20_46_11]